MCNLFLLVGLFTLNVRKTVVYMGTIFATGIGSHIEYVAIRRQGQVGNVLIDDCQCLVEDRVFLILGRSTLRSAKYASDGITLSNQRISNW